MNPEGIFYLQLIIHLIQNQIKMKTVDYLKKYSIYFLLAMGVAFTGCDDDDEAPEEENELEVITDVKLIFTPVGGGAAVEASAQDPDGEGVQDLVILDEITLSAETTYTLTFEIFH